MSIPVEWPRWPNLGGERHPQLDWVVTIYEAGRLREMADAAEQCEWNPWTKATVEALRALAASPTALAELNDVQAAIPREVMGLNRAVHYLVRLEIAANEDKAEARSEVGHIWGKAAATVKEDVVLYGNKARSAIDELLQGLETANRTPRASLLEALDLDMIHRANHMRRET